MQNICGNDVILQAYPLNNGCLWEVHLASDSMYFSEESHCLLFFFVPFSKDVQCGQLGDVHVRRVLSEAFGPMFLSLLWLRLYMGFGYGLGIFQGLHSGNFLVIAFRVLGQ